MSDPPMSEHLEGKNRFGPYVMGTLGPQEGRKVEDHLEECASCRGEAPDLRLAHERLTDLANVTEMPPQELKSRVSTALPRRETRRVPLVAAAAVCRVLAVLEVLYAPGFSKETRSPPPP